MKKAVLSLILKTVDYPNVPWKNPFRNQCFFLVYAEPWELWFNLACLRSILLTLCKSSPWLWSCCPRTLLPCCYSRKTAVLLALGLCHFTVPYLFLIWLFMVFDVSVSTSSSNTPQGCLSSKALFSRLWLCCSASFAQGLLCVRNFHIYKTWIWAEKRLWINTVLLWANHLMLQFLLYSSKISFHLLVVVCIDHFFSCQFSLSWALIPNIFRLAVCYYILKL